MRKLLLGVPAIIGLMMLLSILASNLAFAADPKPLVLGSLDVDKVFEEYEQRKVLEAGLQSEVTSVQMQLDLRTKNPLLTPEEFTQLAGLQARPSPTADEKKKLDDLLALSKQRDQAFQALQQKTDLTDAEKAQLTQFQDQIKTVRATLENELSKKQEDLKKQQVDLSRKIYTDIEKAVAEIAKDKGLTFVLNKNINGSPFVIFSGTDITEDVLKKLNKK